MPLTRYQIRNEYGLADPELYKAADKDDPEALLEGVAMAGLVGVLRQLGDLAEFAAEVFHDLHEEVMVTAARGHGLMARVQQLEAEFPSIEKAFLTQTDQTPFFNNPGVDWHPNLRMEQNMITRGDLPRFVMDSYEECRGPPRLFLLDKFDVAGAGACLKRYTDPSLFKVEADSFGAPTVEVQREKKNRKVKKKGGARGRNGETPEVTPTSHAKLHQLFLEERVENGHSDPARLVKLKRRQLNGFPFDPKPGKSYMEKFLGTPSPENKIVHEVSVYPSPLRLTLNSSDESGLDIIDISTVSPTKESSLGWENSCSPPIGEEPELIKPVTPELNEETYNREISKVPEPIPGDEDDESCTVHKMVIENGLAIDEDRETVGSDHSEDFMSEVDNYMDALTTMESEMETDNEYKTKKDTGLLWVGKNVADSDEHLDIRGDSSDSPSFGNSSASDDLKGLSKKGGSSFSCSDSPRNLGENTPSDNEGETKLENGVSDLIGSPTDHLPVHPENQENNSGELIDGKLDNVNSITENCPGEDHKDLEEEVDDGICDENSVEGKFGSPQSIISPVSVNEEHQTDYGDESSDKNLVEEVGSLHSITSPSKEQLLDSGDMQLPENSDALKSVQVNLGVDDAIGGPGTNLENLTDIVVSPEVNSIEEHQDPDGEANLSGAEEELTGGATYPEENVKRPEVVSRVISGDEMNVEGEGEGSIHHEDPVNYADKSGCDPVNLDEHEGSVPSDFVDIREYLAGNKDPHQNRADSNEGVLPECSIEPEEKKEVEQVEPHIHESALTYPEESSSYELSNKEMESKHAISSPTCSLPGLETSMEHKLEPRADKNLLESALVASDEANPESSKLQDLPCQFSDSRTPPESLELHSRESELVYGASSKSLDTPSQELLISPASQGLSDTGLSKNPFDSVYPTFGVVSKNSEQMPPLPPLPPMQWRMGKLQPPSLASPGQWIDHGKGTFFTADEKFQSDFLSVDQEITHPSNPFLSITSDIQKTQHLSIESQDNPIQSTPLSPGLLSTSIVEESQQVLLPLEGIQSLDPSLDVPITTNDREEDGYVAAGGDPHKSNKDTSSTVAIVEDERTDPVPSPGSQTKPLDHVIPESTSKPEEPENSSQSLAADGQNDLEKSELSPTTMEEQHGQTTWPPSALVLPPTYEVGKSNGSKLPRPRNPLIDAVAAHGKSKLRKVTERVHPQLGPKPEERDTLLEQIRTKSFNLRPTAVTRPGIQGIQGPKTNLKVAAILEKANAIRQALTGSDEDDDTDSWSDDS